MDETIARPNGITHPKETVSSTDAEAALSGWELSRSGTRCVPAVLISYGQTI
jgi:hypothetical protein